MADTNFINGTTVIQADWLNDVNDTVYGLPNSASATVGANLIGFNPTLNYTAGTLGRHVADEFWNPCDFPWLASRNGTSDATAAVQACITAAAAAGKGVLIPLFFSVNSLVIPSNTYLKGVGQGKCGFRQISGANDALHLADPGSASTYTTNVTVEDMTLQGTVATDGFQEVLHLMFTQGCKDLTVQRVTFSGFRGDGLYIGTGNERGQNPSQVRHNKNVRVLDCIFDGETKNNRNGVSVIDCDGCWIERCFFTRTSKSDMPGPIDIEPDGGGTPAGVSAIIRDINVIANKFFDNAGQGMICVNFPNSLTLQTVPIYGINIIANDMDTSAATYGAGVAINCTATVTRSVPELGIKIIANTTKDVYQPFSIRAVRGVDVVRNNWGQSKYSAQIGDSAGVFNTLDIRLRGNTFYKVGNDNSVGGTACFVYGADNVSFTDSNVFDSCGKADASYNANIALDSIGTKSNITVEDNFFYQPTANANSWDVRRDAGVLTVGTVRHARNRLVNVNGGTVNFIHDYIPIDDVQPLSLLNSWVAFGGFHEAPQLWKDAAGICHLRGTIRNGTTTAGTSIANIPAGFRPGKILNYAVAANGAYGEVQIENTIGDLQVVVLASNTRVSLNGISWKAEV